MQKNLWTLEFSVNERQFTQLAHDTNNKKFVVTSFFRNTGIFGEITYKDYKSAKKFYDYIIK